MLSSYSPVNISMVFIIKLSFPCNISIYADNNITGASVNHFAG